MKTEETSETRGRKRLPKDQLKTSTSIRFNRKVVDDLKLLVEHGWRQTDVIETCLYSKKTVDDLIKALPKYDKLF